MADFFRAAGGDLQTFLDAEEFVEEPMCIDVLRDTLRGLQFLHRHSIAHLDIKVALQYHILKT
jgi:serine/threonine protein kinase